MNLPYDKVRNISKQAIYEMSCRHYDFQVPEKLIEFLEIFMTLYMREYTANLQQSVMMKPSINYLPDPIAPSVVIQLTDEQIKNLEIE